MIFESATTFAFIVTDVSGTVVEWSPGAERILGWTAAEMIGRSSNLFFTPEDRAAGRLAAEIDTALREGRADDEHWHLRADGSRFWASGEWIALRDGAQAPRGLVKILRDRTDEHLAEERLREAEERLRQAQEAGGVGVFAIDVGTDVIVATPEFSRLYGLDHLERRPAADFEHLVLPEDRNIVSHDETRRAGAAPRDVEYRIRRPITGEVRWIARKGEFERDAAGRPLRFVGVSRDITDQVTGRRLLDDERELLAQMFEQAPTFMALLRGPEHRFERVNRGYTELAGGRPLVGRTVAEALPEVVGQGFVATLDAVYRSGVAFQADATRVLLRAGPDAPTEERFLDFVYQPIRNRAGAVSGIFVEGADVTGRVLAQERLASAERRYRTLFNSIDTGFCVAEMIFEDNKPIDYRILEHNEAFERHTGLDGSDTRTLRVMVPELEEFWYETYAHVARTGEPARFLHQAVPMGERWFEVYAFRLDDPVPNQVGILFSDISSKVAAENQRQLLNRELSHRLKNTLATVQSIASQTLRSASDVGTARAALTARIQALANAHDILLQGSRDAGSIAEIVLGAVSVHDGDGRIELSGPEILVGSTAALTLSLTCHELATNAGKYGALSVPEGRVSVAWRVEAGPPGEGAAPTFVFDWIERGGPPVAPPARKGFGTRLIEIGLSASSAGAVELDYAPDGVTCRITAPLLDIDLDAAEPRM